MPRPVKYQDKATRLRIGSAVNRVAQEQLVQVRELCELAHAPAPTIRRWIIEGRSGCYLDGVKRPGKGWMSSVPALMRFLAEVRITETTDPDLARAAEERVGESTSPLLRGKASAPSKPPTQ